MRCTIWTAWFDMHCAHADPFKGGGVHGHLWRVRLGKRQDLASRADIRILLGQAKRFAERLDHTDIGTISTEDIAIMALEKTDSDVVQVEEVGICLVELEQSPKPKYETGGLEL